MTLPELITLDTLEQITPTRLFGPHFTFLTALAYSPDGNLLVTADIEGVLRIWDIESGKQQHETRPFNGEITQIVFDRGLAGYRFAIIGALYQFRTLVIDADDDLLIEHNTDFSNYRLLDITFSPDHRPIVAAVSLSENDPKLYLTYADKKELLTAYRSGNDTNPNARFTADGAAIAVGGDDGTVTIRGARKNSSTRIRIQTGFNGVKRTVFSPNGQHLAAIEDRGNQIAVFNTTSGEMIGQSMNTIFAHQVAFNMDGSIMGVTTNQKGGTLALINPATSQTLRTIRGSSPLVFSPTGRAFACGNNYAQYSKSAMVWDSRESPDSILNQIAAPIDDISAETYTVRQLAVLHGHTKPVLALAFNANNRILATAGENDEIHLWNMETGGKIAVLVEHRADITGLAFSPNGRTLASCSGYYNSTDDNTVRLWDLDETIQQLVFEGHRSRVIGVAYPPRADWIISAETDGSILIWNPADGKIQREIKTPSVINDFALSPSGALVATAHGSETALKDTTIRLWNTATGELIREINALSDWVLWVTFSPDGNILLAADYAGRITGWDTTTGTLVKDVTGGDRAIYNPQQTLIATARDKTVQLLAMQSMKLLMPLRHGAHITALQFGWDSDMLAVGTRNGEVIIWGVPKVSSSRANTKQIEQQRLERARSGRHMLQLISITCHRSQERDGDEVFIRLDGQTIWSIERAGRKMHHNLTKPIEVNVFDFRSCKMKGRDGWQTTQEFEPDDFRITGLTGPVKLELWEEDNFLRGGNDFFGEITISTAQAGQGELEAVIYADGSHYVIVYEVLFE